MADLDFEHHLAWLSRVHVRAVIKIIRQLRHNRITAYQVAIGTAAFATLVRATLALTGQVIEGLSFLTFYPAILIAALLGGLLPGIFALVLSILIAWYFFLPPVFSFRLDERAVIELSFFVATGFICVLITALVNELILRIVAQELAAEDNAAKSEAGKAHLQEALEAGSVLAYDWDATTDSVQYSNNAAKILGYDLQQVFNGKSLLSRIHPDDLVRLRALWSTLNRDNAAYSTSYRFLRPDGCEIWVQENSRAEFDDAGRLLRVKGLARDITERKRAEEHDALLRLAQVRTGVGVWGWDPRTGELGLSPELEELYGLKPGSLKDYTDFRKHVHPDDIEYVEASRDAAIQKHQSFQHELRVIRPDGETRWLASTGSAVYDEVTGKPIRILGSIFDITERKRAEERQGKLVAELDHRVKNVLAQVAVVASSTRQGSRSIDEFLGSLEGRIRSMAIAHTLLSTSGWQSVRIDTLVRDELAPYATESNVVICGPDVVLNAAETQALARVLHELATNAAKYGALSIPGGQVSINWNVNGAMTNLNLVWRELGGPPVASEHPSGYGTSLICNLIPHELGGTVDLVFAKEGVNCRIEIPIKLA